MTPTDDPAREPAVRAFCSYAHTNNGSFLNTIQYIVEDLRALHEDETGRPLKIFFDRTDIGWGEDLRMIADSVENATVFIPFVTALYFQSAECRSELLSFYGKSRMLGVTELILPVVLAGRSQISLDSDDEVVRIIAQVRFADWSEVWQTGRKSAAWKIGITQLVQRLVDLQAHVEEHLVHAFTQDAEATPGADNAGAPGTSRPSVAKQLEQSRAEGRPLLDVVQRVVGDFERFLRDLDQELTHVEVTDPYAMRADLDRIGARYSTRGQDLVQVARETLEHLVEFDADIRNLIRTRRQISNQDQESLLRKDVEDLRESALTLAESIRVVDGMSSVLRRYGDVSVGLRVALSPARAGLQSIRDMANILEGWISLEV
jgi:hypothetical protein